jgi:hypothetical protein
VPTGLVRRALTVDKAAKVPTDGVDMVQKGGRWHFPVDRPAFDTSKRHDGARRLMLDDALATPDGGFRRNPPRPRETVGGPRDFCPDAGRNAVGRGELMAEPDDSPEARAHALTTRILGLVKECRAMVPELTPPAAAETPGAQAERHLYLALLGALEAGLVRTVSDALAV